MKALQVIKELIKNGSTGNEGTFSYLPFDTNPDEFIHTMFGEEYELWEGELKLESEYIYSHDASFMYYECPDATLINPDNAFDCIFLYLIE